MASLLHQLTFGVLFATSCSSFAKDKQLYYTGRHGNYTWPRRELSVSLDGDIVLGALHMVHERSEEKTCGAIMSQGGIQALETMLYTLDEINRDPDLLPGIKLGTLAKDDCDRDIYGLEQAVDFIRAMDSMVIRSATLEDKDEVVAIRYDFLDGLDYIATFYEHLLSCPNAKAYVGVINGKVMAFAVAFVVDDGQTVVIRSGRVSEKYKGDRYYTVLHTHAIKESGVWESSYMRFGTNERTVKKTFLSTVKPVYTKAVHRYLFNPKALGCPLISQRNRHGQPTIRLATTADLEYHLTSEDHKSYLFPDNALIVNFVPYRLLPSNVPLIGVPGHTSMLTDVAAGSQSGLLSAITVFPSNYPRYTAILEIYGSDSCSVETHVTAQIEYIKTHVVDGQVGLHVFFYPHISHIASSIERVMNCLGVKRRKWKSTANPEIEYTTFSQFRFSFDLSQTEVSKL